MGQQKKPDELCYHQIIPKVNWDHECGWTGMQCGQMRKAGSDTNQGRVAEVDEMSH